MNGLISWLDLPAAWEVDGKGLAQSLNKHVDFKM